MNNKHDNKRSTQGSKKPAYDNKRSTQGGRKSTYDNKKPAWKKPRQRTVRPLEVVVENGDVVQALRLLKRKMSDEGVLAELKKRRFAEKPSEKKRRKHREYLKKMRKSHGKRAKANKTSSKSRKSSKKKSAT